MRLHTIVLTMTFDWWFFSFNNIDHCPLFGLGWNNHISIILSHTNIARMKYKCTFVHFIWNLHICAHAQSSTFLYNITISPSRSSRMTSGPMVSLTTPSSLRMLMLSLATSIREPTVQVGAGKLAAAFSGTLKEWLSRHPIPPQTQSVDDKFAHSVT